MFLNGTESSEWMFSSQLWGWLKHSLPPETRRMYLALCIQICSQVQNFEKLVQESWLALAILAKTPQKHYANTFTPVGGEDAAVVAWPEAAARQLLTVISSRDLYLAPSWKTADHFPPRDKVLWVAFQSLLGDCPQGNFHGVMNVPPAMPLCSFCCCSRCEVMHVVWPNREV